MEYTNLFGKLFYTLLLLKAAIQFYLFMRNRTHVTNHRSNVPNTFHDKITLAEHQKSADYTVAQMNSSLFFLFYHLGTVLLWTSGGLLSHLNTWATSFDYEMRIQGIILIGSFMMIESLFDLPESLYKTFVLEERFGFNRTNFKIFIQDLFKQTLLSLIIGLPILYGLLTIITKLEENWWIYAWCFLTSVQLLMLWLYPRIIAPLFNKFQPLEDALLKEKIFNLLKKVQFECQGIFVMDASKRSGHGNAYFTGLGKNKRVVFFDTLIKNLTHEQTEAVLAHELGHFRLRHIQKMLFISLLTSLAGFYILAKLAASSWFYETFNIIPANQAVAIVIFMLTLPVFTFFLTPLFSSLSRKHEFEADHFASEHSPAQELISALVTLYRENSSTLTPDPWFSRIYHSHPPALERISALELLIKKEIG